MHALHIADYIIIAGYTAVSQIVGLMMTRKASTNTDHYFLARRSLPWYLLGVAGMTSCFDLTGTMIVTSFLYMIGPRGLFIGFRGGAVLVLAFLMCYAGKWHRRSGCMTTLSFVGAIGFSLVTPPTDERRLIHFYRTTWPFGLWGPVRRKVEQELLERMDRENRNDEISVPFALLWQITLFLLPMQLIIKTYDAFLWTLPLHLVALAGLYWFWWRNLPKADEPVQPA